MLKKLEYEGICSTCKNAPHCIFRKDATSPILQCEEFENFPPVTRNNIPKHLGAVSATTIQTRGTSNYKGLCINCTKVETCTFPKPEGGVWRCEEYE